MWEYHPKRDQRQEVCSLAAFSLRLHPAFRLENTRYPPYVTFVVIDADFAHASHNLRRLRRISYLCFLYKNATKPRSFQNYVFLYIP